MGCSDSCADRWRVGVGGDLETALLDSGERSVHKNGVYFRALEKNTTKK